MALTRCREIEYSVTYRRLSDVKTNIIVKLYKSRPFNPKLVKYKVRYESVRSEINKV